jgi:hypothetical protein
VSLCLNFCEQGFGFGEIVIVQTPEGVFVDGEQMNLKRVRRYVSMLLDGAIADTDKDAEKHALYNRVMRRSCGPGCAVCGDG